MPRVTLLPLLALVLAAGVAWPGEFEEGLDLFRQAAEARDREGEGSPAARDLFRRAAEKWESSVRRGEAGTRLYTNIGNARAFAGDLGEAVLSYRRALILDARNDRARDALDTLRAGLGIVGAPESPSTGLLRTLFFWHDALRVGTRKTLFGIAWIASLSILLVSRRRRRLRLPGLLLLLAALALFVSLVISDYEGAREADSVLLTRTEGRTGDGDFYSVSHTAPLPAGTEIRILERRGRDDGWIHGRLRDGTTTWVPARAVEEVVPRER